MAGNTIQVTVLAETRKFQSAMSNLSKQTGLSKLTSAFKTLGKVATVGFAAGAAGAVVLTKQLVDAGEAASTSNARIQQIADSMGIFGDASKDVTNRLVKLAETTARQTGVDQNSIKATQAKLLTFKELATTAGTVGGQFDRATQAAIDLAAAGFGSAEENATQLGKALNDPIKGITALTRSGVTFTEAEKAQIKAMVEAGDTAGAQNLILSALETQVGGTAEATANATDKMKVAWSQVQEKIGQKLLPVLETFSTWFTETALPAIEDFISKAIDVLGPKIEALAKWFKNDLQPRLEDLAAIFRKEVLPRVQAFGDWITGTAVPALQDFGAWVGKNADWLKALAVVVGTIVVGISAYVRVMAIWKAATAVATAVQAAFNAVLTANPIGIIILAIAALVAGLIYFFTKTETGKKIVETVWGAIKTAIEAVTNWWNDTAYPTIKKVWDAIVGAFQNAKDAVVRFMQGIWDFIKLVWNWSPYGMIINNWDKITAFFGRVKDKVVSFFQAAWDFIKKAWSYSPLGIIVTNWDAIIAFFRDIPNKIKAFFSNAKDWLVQAGKDIIQGMINGLKSMLGSVGDVARNVGTSVVNGVKSVLRIGSPSKVFRDLGRYTIQGLEIGLEEVTGLKKTMTKVSGVVTSGFDPTLTLSGGGVLTHSTAASGGSRTYNINVSTGVGDPVAIGREVKSVLQAYERVNGR